MKYILAFDSFKGSLTAEEAVAAAREGLLSVQPDAEVVCLPMADGGEGTTAALARCMNAAWRSVEVHDPLMRPIEARYAQSGTTAIMEMAEAAGLTLLSESERNPMHTTTYGVGEMMLDAVRHGCTHIMIGIGGSATNDGGIGMLAALGARFSDSAGMEFKPPAKGSRTLPEESRVLAGGHLNHIAAIEWDILPDLSGVDIDVVCDVTNPLYGHQGAARVYAMQKGAGADEVDILDRGLRHLSQLCSTRWRRGMHNTRGAGAAGGLGYALLLLGGRLRSGTDTILDAVGLEGHLPGTSLILTGEGKCDSQTLNGKLPYGILQRAKPWHIPVVCMAGKVEERARLLEAGFADIVCINTPATPIAQAMATATASSNLAATVSRLLSATAPPTA